MLNACFVLQKNQTNWKMYKNITMNPSLENYHHGTKTLTQKDPTTLLVICIMVLALVFTIRHDNVTAYFTLI